MSGQALFERDAVAPKASAAKTEAITVLVAQLYTVEARADQ